MTEQQAAAYLRQFMLAGEVAPVDRRRVWWYDLFDDGDTAANTEHRFGLIDRAGVKRPAFQAAAEVTRQGGGAMSATRDSRLLTVDVARGIGILLVVLGHNAVFRESSHALYEAIYLFHMPLFFFVSGVTFRLTSPGEDA